MNPNTKLISLLLALIFCLCLVPVSALGSAVLPKGEESAILGSGECGDNVTWKIAEDGVMTISGTGEMYDYDSPNSDADHDVILGYSPWYSFYEKHEGGDRCYVVNSVIVEDGVTRIGKAAFNNFRMLTNVCIGNTVTEIGAASFAHCTRLKSVTIPDSVRIIGDGAFRDCRSMSELKLSDNLTKIGSWAFCDCDKLVRVTIPAGRGQEISLGRGPFAGMDSLEEMEVLGKIKNGSGYEDCSFSNCKSLKKLILPAVDVFDPLSVHACSALTDIYYPGSKAKWNSIYIDRPGYDLGKNVKIHTYYRYNELTNCTVKLKYSSYGYTGKAIKPKVAEVRTCSGTKLTEGEHYTIVGYENNKDFGVGSVIISGIGKYSGTVYADFNIVPAKPKGVKVSDIELDEEHCYPGTTYYKAVLSWDPVPGATRYQVTYWGSKRGETEDTSYSLDRLSRSDWSLGVRALVDVTDPVTGKTVTYVGNRTIIQYDPRQ